MALDQAGIDEAARTATLSFSSESPVIRSSWLMGQWTEILRHEPQAVDLSRISSIGVLLYQHSMFSPIGQITEAWLDDKDRKCKANVRFDADPESDKVFQKVLSGTLRGVSVGYRVMDEDWEVVKAGKRSSCGRFEGACEIANRWMPYEASIVTIPADASVGVGRAAFLDSEMSAESFARLADAISERIIKNIPFEIKPQAEELPVVSGEREQIGEPSRLKVLRRKLELLSM
jgi:HK97 family phage prohead protease